MRWWYLRCKQHSVETDGLDFCRRARTLVCKTHVFSQLQYSTYCSITCSSVASKSLKQNACCIISGCQKNNRGIHGELVCSLCHDTNRKLNQISTTAAAIKSQMCVQNHLHLRFVRLISRFLVTHTHTQSSFGSDKQIEMLDSILILKEKSFKDDDDLIFEPLILHRFSGLWTSVSLTAVYSQHRRWKKVLEEYMFGLLITTVGDFNGQEESMST